MRILFARKHTNNFTEVDPSGRANKLLLVAEEAEEEILLTDIVKIILKAEVDEAKFIFKTRNQKLGFTLSRIAVSPNGEVVDDS